MSIKKQRDAMKRLADAQRRAGQTPFLEWQRNGLTADYQAWFRSGMALMKSAMLTIEVAQSATDRWRVLANEDQNPMTAEMVSATQNCQLWPVGQMLLSMAFEAMFKGLLAVAHTKIPTGPSGHNLRQLADRAGLPLSEKAKELLEELTLLNQLGRYPVHMATDIATIHVWGLDNEVIEEILAHVTSWLPADPMVNSDG